MTDLISLEKAGYDAYYTDDADMKKENSSRDEYGIIKIPTFSRTGKMGWIIPKVVSEQPMEEQSPKNVDVNALKKALEKFRSNRR